VKVGNDTTIFANVSVYDDCEIGARCRIHSGTVIGSDGFSFVPDEQGRQVKLPQVGRVVVEDDVEIGAGCCVDRAGFGETRIRRGAKFDNLIQIGHNGTNQHITVGDHVIITARTGVTKSVEAGKMVGGMMPAQDYQQWRKSQVLYARLPELFERLKKLEKERSKGSEG